MKKTKIVSHNLRNLQLNNLITLIEIFRYRFFRLFYITRYMIRRILLQNSLFTILHYHI